MASNQAMLDSIDPNTGSSKKPLFAGLQYMKASQKKIEVKINPNFLNDMDDLDLIPSSQLLRRSTRNVNPPKNNNTITLATPRKSSSSKRKLAQKKHVFFPQASVSFNSSKKRSLNK